MEKIRIKYLSPDIEKIQKIDVGNWIDLRAAEDCYIPAGETALIPLGVAMELPEGYEALLAPRSSTYRKYHMVPTHPMCSIALGTKTLPSP